MPVERTADRTSFLDALDRVLDKGIVIDAWMRASLGGVGIDLITVETSVIVVSIATYLRTSAAGVPLTPCGRAATAATSTTRRRARSRLHGISPRKTQRRWRIYLRFIDGFDGQPSGYAHANRWVSEDVPRPRCLRWRTTLVLGDRYADQYRTPTLKEWDWRRQPEDPSLYLFHIERDTTWMYGRILSCWSRARGARRCNAARADGEATPRTAISTSRNGPAAMLACTPIRRGGMSYSGAR